MISPILTIERPEKNARKYIFAARSEFTRMLTKLVSNIAFRERALISPDDDDIKLQTPLLNNETIAFRNHIGFS
jgi:hypothetical protein